MQTTTLKIGTRGSPLALAQAQETRSRLMAAHALPETAFSIDVISTSGDRIQDRPLSEVGGKGLFTKEIEEALLSGRIDIAVHSSKDMATRLPEGLELSAFLEREDPRDAFVGRASASIEGLPLGATVGSSSLRRQAQVLRLRPDLKVVMFRGNVQTRLRKLDDGIADGTILALAGLNRLGMPHIATDVMSVEMFPPAPGQGAIAIETRSGDTRISELVAAIHHAPTGHALVCERAFLSALDGSCRMPLAGYAATDGDRLTFSGSVLSPDGTQYYHASGNGSAADAAEIGLAAAEKVRAQAGPRFFDDWG